MQRFNSLVVYIGKNTKIVAEFEKFLSDFTELAELLAYKEINCWQMQIE